MQPKRNFKTKPVGMDKPLDFGYIVLVLIEKITEAKIHGALDSFMCGVEQLEDLMIPFHNKGYEKELNEINKEYEELRKSKKARGRIPATEEHKLEYMKSRAVFRALMMLIKKTGLIPKTDIDVEF